MANPKQRLLPPKLDMNPMVDMAFLLVSFFMLTTTFKTAEPILIEKAKSERTIKVPEKDVVTITVAKDGKVFFGIDGKFARQRLLQSIGNHFDITFDDTQLNQFALTSSFGLPIQEMEAFLDTPPNERLKYQQAGIPVDSMNNQLADWVIYARAVNPKTRYAINADKSATYQVVDQVIQTLIDHHIYRFNLITELEKTD